MGTLGRPFAIVTGASSGIGFELAKCCIGSGHDVLSFSYALRAELKDSGVTVTCLMPGPTETKFFDRADLMDTKVGTGEKQPADEVARIGFEAMLRGEGGVVAGWKNKLEVAASRVMTTESLAERHRDMAAPGTAAKS